MLTGSRLLKAAASFSFAVALLHLAIVFVGAPAYRYFGAGEDMAAAAERGRAFPALLTLLLVAVFGGFGCYALSGAGTIRRLPLSKAALVLIAAIYTARGLAVFQQVSQVGAAAAIELRQVVFSAVSLVIGLTYSLGTILGWHTLARLPPERAGSPTDRAQNFY